ncbi:hypothetical protein LXM50_16495 [Microbacterium sp. Au-Mic1]|uniref:hypothetical protein n=1 Tax=Microbacterium sp. Au-Mic1 TaxID=2906457 RepID=UPI001E2F4868|nr:hypothetical protein [Microbacterium sp. Au-Mic1]MCE4027577.1 hypothetical protein [Microbacterium sp. Au-Mic1]
MARTALVIEAPASTVLGRLRAELPIKGTATQVALLAETANGGWHRAMTFSLAPAAP